MILEILQGVCLSILFFFNGATIEHRCRCGAESKPVLITQAPVVKPPVFKPRKPPKP